METPGFAGDGIKLIFCGGGNRRFGQIAIDAGFLYGAQLPDTVYFPIHFADQDWRKPDRAKYMAELAKHRPTMATVLDWEREEQLLEVLSWAEEAAHYVEQIVIVPKMMGGISNLPRRIDGKRVILGYSVPTRYAGTELPIWEFAGWPVHLLGGSPHRQMQIWSYLDNICEVVSVDGNMISKMATRYCQFWLPGTADYARNRWWPTLQEADEYRWGKDAPYEAFRRSCANIMAAWQALAGLPVGQAGMAGGPQEVVFEVDE